MWTSDLRPGQPPSRQIGQSGLNQDAALEASLQMWTSDLRPGQPPSRLATKGGLPTVVGDIRSEQPEVAFQVWTSDLRPGQPPSQ